MYDPEIWFMLQALAAQHPSSVIARLERGSLVRKGGDAAYLIDDPDLDLGLGDASGRIPYGAIHRALRSSETEIRELFMNEKVVPFSKAFAAGIGVCLEKSILMQLSAQRNKTSFLINGYLSDGYSSPRAFNVVFLQNFLRKGPTLVDAENPLAVKPDGKTLPYCMPVFGLEGDDRTFVLSEQQPGRIYSVF